jgi:AraC-like DNA-binding protein
MTTLQFKVLAGSPAVRDRLRALGTLAGMAVNLVPVARSPDPPVVARGMAPLCRLILRDPNGAAACRQFLAGMQSQFKCGVPGAECAMNLPSRTSPQAKPRPARALRLAPCAVQIEKCFAGLAKLASPITAHGGPVATLMCGAFFTRKPTEQDFKCCLQELRRRGVHLDPEPARKAYFESRIARPACIQAAGQLLADLAKHLSEMAGRCLVGRQAGEPPCVACAKKLVAKQLGEMPTTRSAAREAHVTAPYFCRMFKAATGMTFSEFVARAHVERARGLLHDPKLRVTDVAFGAGFQSIPHFNHTFKRYTGLSPNGYRASLRKA